MGIGPSCCHQSYPPDEVKGPISQVRVVTFAREVLTQEIKVDGHGVKPGPHYEDPVAPPPWCIATCHQEFCDASSATPSRITKTQTRLYTGVSISTDP